LNRHFLCNPSNTGPTSTWGAPRFGTVVDQCNQPRHVDFGLKLYW
jgi:hypothetical protein